MIVFTFAFFQEFLDTVVLFSRGATEDKLRIIFDMCDDDRNGVIDKGELSEMLRSLVEIARTTSLRDEHVTELIDGMFSVSMKWSVTICKLCAILINRDLCYTIDLLQYGMYQLYEIRDLD